MVDLGAYGDTQGRAIVRGQAILKIAAKEIQAALVGAVVGDQYC